VTSTRSARRAFLLLAYMTALLEVRPPRRPRIACRIPSARGNVIASVPAVNNHARRAPKLQCRGDNRDGVTEAIMLALGFMRPLAQDEIRSTARRATAYIVEFKTAAGDTLAISVPSGETAVLQYSRRAALWTGRARNAQRRPMMADRDGAWPAIRPKRMANA
jgi:hypothetical protein